jgi:hypothetical protein
MTLPDEFQTDPKTPLLGGRTETVDADGARRILRCSSCAAPLSALAVSCHLSILRPDAVGPMGITCWTMCETRFLIWSALVDVLAAAIVFLLCVVSALPIFLLLGISDGPAGSVALAALLAPAMSVGAHFAARFSLMLPAIALGLRPIISDVLEFSHGNGWRLTLTVLVLPIGVSLIVGLATRLLPELGAVSILVSVACMYATTLIEVSVLSVAFRTLVRPDRMAGSGPAA